tara:strand:- start:4678 stop:6708 length:2031 start_codon:yes stop_codon:yes gene_type:complete
MIYRIYGQKDATIYEQTNRTAQNTGADEILEVTKFYDEDTDSIWIGNSRILTKFDLTEISSSIVAGDISGSIKYYLNLTSTEENEIQSEYQLDIYPVSQSWSEGTGKWLHTPVTTNGVSWQYPSGTETWNTDSASIFNGVEVSQSPTEGILLLQNFSNGTGSLFLTESINDINGNSPSMSILNEQLIISASNFAGTTLVIPLYLENSRKYGVQFQIDPKDYTDVQFRVETPSGVIQNQDTYTDMVGNITTASTQSFDLTSTETGEYKLRFTFFDNDGSTASTEGVFDELFVTEKDGNTLVWETFSVNKGGFVQRDVITNSNGNSPILQTSASKLSLKADNIGGASAEYIKELSSELQYTITSELNLGNYPSIGFDLYNPLDLTMSPSQVTGLQSEYTSSVTQSLVFTPPTTGKYRFNYSYFASGSVGATGSIDNFKIVFSGSLSEPPQIQASFFKNKGGGTWYTSSINNTKYSQSFTKYTSNLNSNVTDYVNDWLNGSRVNDGFLIKRPLTQESSSTRFGSSKFFSNETHTIYVPTLEVRWVDSTFNTGSLSSLTADDILVYPKNLSSEYKEKSKDRIRIVGRERYPQRSFSDSNPYTTIKYLPQNTYYQVRDVETNLVLIPYDTTYTKVSCDSTGNYFDFWFNTLQPERFYQFEFRVDRGGTQQYFDGNVFKVVR